MLIWPYGYTDISSPIHAYMLIWLHVSLSLCLYDYMPPTYPMLMFLSFYFLTAADDYPLLLYFSPYYYFLDMTHSVFSTCWYMLLPTLCSLSSSSTFFYPRFRKLPWLSRQSDRLLTDRSLVRSQAEAPFLLFRFYISSLYLLSLSFLKKYASRGSRTHDRAVKSRALYRLS